MAKTTVTKTTDEVHPLNKRLVSSKVLGPIIGRAPSSIDKDRFFDRGLPYYRFLGKVLYDLDEVLQLVKRERIQPGKATSSRSGMRGTAA
jgi:hypothetical protein